VAVPESPETPPPTRPRQGEGWDFYDESDEWGRGEWAQQVEQPPRPWPSSSVAYLVVVLVGTIGLVLMAVVGWGQADDGLFRPGALLVATAVCLAALGRAFLSDEAAGMLALRSRRIDVLVYAVLGVSAVVLAVLVPPPA
jgi:hypothetical protein